MSKFIFVTLSVFTLIVAIGYVHFKHIFTFTTITCDVSDQPCPSYLTAEWQKFKGKSIFFSDIDSEGQRIVTLAPSLTNFSYQKKLPNQLHVHFTAAAPVYALEIHPQQFLEVDSQGMINTIVSTPSALPIVLVAPNALPPLDLHQTIDSQLNMHLQSMWNFLAQNPQPITQITIDSPTALHFDLDTHQQVLLDINTIETELSKLPIVITTMKNMKMKDTIKTIDLRFEHPVLKP